MFPLLNPDENSQVKPLFRDLSEHMAIESALSGKSNARIYADSPDCPTAAIIWMRYRLFLAGAAREQAVISKLSRLFSEEILPQQLQAGRDIFILHYSPESWDGKIAELLPGISTIRYWRQYYCYRQADRDWRSMLPEGFSLRPVDENLLNGTDLENLPELKDEMCSERSSVAEFLEKSFGVCLSYQGELAGWCLSEYNQDGGCEIGIAVQEAYRQRGLATLMTAAFIDEARQRGIHKIGWDCWKENHPSVATALKAGFELVEEYPVYYCSLTKEES